MTIWRMRISCWIPNIRSQYVTFIAFPLHQWLQERAPMLRYIYMARLFSPFLGLSVLLLSMKTWRYIQDV